MTTGLATHKPDRRANALVLTAVCVLLTLALRAPFLTDPLKRDEAGFSLVAQHCCSGPYLYGTYWADRPPLLILVYWLGDALGGALGLRLLACVVAVVTVLAAGWAGHLLRGTTGAWWGALVAAALGSSFAFHAQVMNGKQVAATMVMLSLACTLAAVRPVAGQPGRATRLRAAFAVAAGVTAMCAVLTQQSYIDGFVFAVVLLAVAWRWGHVPAADAVRTAVGGVVGSLLPLLVAVAWTLTSGSALSQLWRSMYGYRSGTLEVLSSSGMDEALGRLATLSVLVVISGLVLVAWFVVRGRPEVDAHPAGRSVRVAIIGTLAVAVLGMALSGSWWQDYVVQLVPPLALGAALVAPEPTRTGVRMRVSALLTVVAATFATVVGATSLWGPVPDRTEQAVGRWLAESSQDDDTAFVAWGNANVLHEAEMTSPYRYLWSLPTRTLDADLRELFSVLRGPHPPTWIVEWNGFDSWQLDRSGALTALVNDKYVRVGSPCGRDVYLLRSESRDVVPLTSCEESIEEE